MTAQLGLFVGLARAEFERGMDRLPSSPDQLPLARRSDPVTSHQAAARAASFAVSHRNRIMAVLTEPLTIKEIAARCSGDDIDHVAVARRMPELKALGLAQPTDEKRDGCRVWRRKAAS